MRVMILSVTAGFGHHATAKAVSDQLEAMGATVETFDIYEYINGAIKETIDKGYLFTSKHTQELYRIGYLLAENGGKGYYATRSRRSARSTASALPNSCAPSVHSIRT